MILGTLKEIWRYPVKSMGGESLRSAVINAAGLAGDRCWAVVDGESGEIRNAKKWPELLNYHAHLDAGEDIRHSGYGAEVPDVRIHCPDGDVIAGRDTGAQAAIAVKLARAAGLAPLAPPGERSHYQLTEARTEATLKEELQLFDDEPFPDFAGTPEEILLALADCVTPPGTYVDAYPLHLMTTNSLRFLAERGGVDAVKERYRPNLLVEPSEQQAELTENNWLDSRVQIGGTILRIQTRTVRCSMPSREQAWCGVEADQGMARAMVDHCERHLGVYVMVETGGTVSVGDEVLLLGD